MKKTISVLEDNEEILGIVTIILEEDGFEVNTFENVSAFNAAFPVADTALYLLDVMLPDGNGLEVCKMIKADARTKNLPVVIMTANARMERMKDECAADDFIAKPFDINDFSARIQALTFNRSTNI